MVRRVMTGLARPRRRRRQRNGTCICFYELGFSFFCCSLMTWYDAKTCAGLFAIVYWFPFRFSSRFLSFGSYLWLPLLPPSYPHTCISVELLPYGLFSPYRGVCLQAKERRVSVFLHYISPSTLCPTLRHILLVGAFNRACCIIPHISISS